MRARSSTCHPGRVAGSGWIGRAGATAGAQAPIRPTVTVTNCVRKFSRSVGSCQTETSITLQRPSAILMPPVGRLMPPVGRLGPPVSRPASVSGPSAYTVQIKGVQTMGRGAAERRVQPVSGFMGSVRMQAARGFTLIEVMIAVAIVAILATLAYPSYMDSVRKSNGRALQGFLMDVSTRQNQYLLDKRRYADDLVELGVTAPSDVDRHYAVVIVAANTPPSFELTATAKAGSPQTQGGWNELKLNSVGTKTPAEKW